MKKVALILILIMLVVLSGCSLLEKDTVASCYNGNFVGEYLEDTGVISFKGIPYAKAPVGELRWKAPQSVDKSRETFNANAYGKSSIQYYWFSEPITTEVSENCLTLNVWTKDLKKDNRPVMVFFHGGAFAWGGSSESIYDGQYIVSEHEDVIVVTCNYRVGMMGFIDFSQVPGGEEFPDSKELGLLDCIESLKWIKQNISSFGGDPNNITIFGESAGGGIVSCLLASDYAGELFNRVIAQSGNLRMTYTDKQFSESMVTDMLLKVSGAKNMDDLMALTEEELIEINETELDSYGTCINDIYNMPYNGGIVKADPYLAIKNAQEKGVDLLISTTENEQNYWIVEMGDDFIFNLDEEEIKDNMEAFEKYYLSVVYDSEFSFYTKEERKIVQTYLNNHGGDSLSQVADLLTQLVYRMPAIRMAEAHQSGTGNGKTYMVCFNILNEDYPVLGACHACELHYVFHDLSYSDVNGKVDSNLADMICGSWVNFSKSGDPNYGDVVYQEYDTENRWTTVFTRDGATLVSDYEGDTRELLSKIKEYPLYPNGA